MDSGLEGVVAAETELSHSDGSRGILWVRGHTLAELVTDYGYQGAVALLWEGFCGDGLSRSGIRDRLGAGREAAFAWIGEWLGPAACRPLAEGVLLALAHLSEDSTPAGQSPRHCRSRSPPWCAAGEESLRSHPIRASAPPPISCACCRGRRRNRR